MMKNQFLRHYRLRNYLHSLLLLAGMLVLLSLIGWLLAGPPGILWFLLAGLFIVVSVPRITPAFILRLHGAQPLTPAEAPQLYQIIITLSEKAGLKNAPALYYIPNSLMNAFTTGLHQNAAIAISDGMLRRLDVRELTAVLAHELSHIYSHDLLVMLVADVISRLTSVLAFTGFFLIWIYIPLYILTDDQVPWLLLIVLMMAPTMSALMQLALSRSREFNADTEAVRLTGDPLALASALEKIDRYQGGWIERMLMPNRRVREPSLLRTHPLMVDRVKRLRQLALQKDYSAYTYDVANKQQWLPFVAAEHTLRSRFPGTWY